MSAGNPILTATSTTFTRLLQGQLTTAAARLCWRTLLHSRSCSLPAAWRRRVQRPLPLAAAAAAAAPRVAVAGLQRPPLLEQCPSLHRDKEGAVRTRSPIIMLRGPTAVHLIRADLRMASRQAGQVLAAPQPPLHQDPPQLTSADIACLPPAGSQVLSAALSKELTRVQKQTSTAVLHT